MFIRTEVEEIQTAVFSSPHSSIHGPLLVLRLRPRRIGSTSAYHTVRHQGGDTCAVTAAGRCDRLDLSSSCSTASHVCAVSNRGYQVWFCSHSNHHCVHLGNTCFHLEHETFWISDTVGPPDTASAQLVKHRVESRRSCLRISWRTRSHLSPTCRWLDLNFPSFSRDEVKPLSLTLGSRWRLVGL